MTSAAASVSERATSALRAAASGTRLFVPLREWPSILYWTALITLLLAPLYVRDSLLISLAIASTVFIIAHSLYAARSVPWIPGFIALIGTLQWSITAWLAYHLLADAPGMRMVVDSQTYFGYMVPAAIALFAGMYLPLWGVGQRGVSSARAVSVTVRDARRMANILMYGGLFSRLALVPIMPMSLRYVFQLLGCGAYVGAFIAMLADLPGWRWRVLGLLGFEAFVDSFWGQYLELFLWMGFTAALYVYRFRVKKMRLAVLALAGLSLISAINLMKSALRSEIREGGYDAAERARMAMEYTSGLLGDPETLYSGKSITYNIGRLNQGSIISMIMAWTPAREPFAGGETVLTALHSAFVPRLLDADKYVAGKELYTRFTGAALINGTSINLSVPGELYANYGVEGGWIACLVFGLVVGLIFRTFIVLSRRSHLWWAWAPFVLFTVPVAETGLTEIVNQIAKSIIVMVFLVMISPFWMRLLRSPRGWPASSPGEARGAGPIAPVAPEGAI